MCRRLPQQLLRPLPSAARQAVAICERPHALRRPPRAGVLAERVRELGQLAAEDEPGLTRNFDLWLGALGRKWA